MSESDPATSADGEPSLRYTTDIHVRFADFDPLGHVNNAAYSTYLEQARIRYMNDVVDVSVVDFGSTDDTRDETGYGTVLANTDIDFRAPVDELGEVSIALATVRLGTSSFTMAYEAQFRDSVVLTAETTQVVIDSETGRPTPVPDDWRDRILAFEDHF